MDLSLIVTIFGRIWNFIRKDSVTPEKVKALSKTFEAHLEIKKWQIGHGEIKLEPKELLKELRQYAKDEKGVLKDL